MKGAFLAFLAGVGSAVAVAGLASGRAQRAARMLSTIDLNKSDAEDFVALGLTPEMAERIIENRPYRSRLELLERFVLTKVDFDAIKHRVGIDVAHAHDAVQVAS